MYLGGRSFFALRTKVCGDEETGVGEVVSNDGRYTHQEGAQQWAPFLCFAHRSTVVGPWHKEVERVVLK